MDELLLYRTIRAQALERIAEITARPRPSYQLDGQSVAWSDYLARLEATVDWCNQRLNGEEPFERATQGCT